MGDGPRQYLTDREWATMFKDQGERCKLCPDTIGPFQADHSNPNYFDSKKPDQLLCVPCHKEKTKGDKKLIYKTKRLNGEASSQASRRATRKAEGKPSLIPTRPMGPSRGFEKRPDRPMQSRPLTSRSSFKRRDEEAPRSREEILRGF